MRSRACDWARVVSLELGRVFVGTDLILLCDLLENLFAVICPEGLRGILAAILEQNLLASRMLFATKRRHMSV